MNNLTGNKINEAEKDSRNTGLTDSTSAEAEEHIEKRGKLTALCNKGERSCARNEIGIAGHKGTCATAKVCSKAEEQEHACGNGRVSKVASKTAEEALNYNDSEHRADNTLPYRSVCAKIKSKNKTCNYCGKIENRLFFFSYKVKYEFRNNRS